MEGRVRNIERIKNTDDETILFQKPFANLADITYIGSTNDYVIV